METVEKFFKWFRGVGGTTPGHASELLKRSFAPLPEPESSFKNRAEEVKRMYNHKFRLKSRLDDFLKDEPDIDTLNFERI